MLDTIMTLLPLIFISILVLWLVDKARGKSKGAKTKPKFVKETKCTCVACGNIWYYGKQELFQNKMDRNINAGAELSNAGKDMMCCGGCLPTLFMPREQLKQVKDLNKCPACNSSAIKKEQITHEI